MPPLNGTKTHPLKPASLAVLRELAEGSMEAFRINPGVRDRLTREGLAEEYLHKRIDGAQRRYRITEAGRKALS